MATVVSNAAARFVRRPLRVMRMAVALLPLCAAGASHGAETRSLITVAITVPEVARLEVNSKAFALQVSAQDLERGYVDVLEPTNLTVFSNARTGFALDVLPLSPLVQSIEVRGMGKAVELGAEGGSIVQRWERPQLTRLFLTFRLGLNKSIGPGIYPWPLHLAVQPLHQAP
jgi:hypothetical protein